MSQFNVLIFTRLALGVANPSVQRMRTEFLINGPYNSLAKQTDQRFEWYVLADDLLEQETEDRIQKVFRAHGNFHLRRRSTFDKRERIVQVDDRLSRKRKGTDAGVVQVRLDDDDLLNLSYVESLRQEVSVHGAASLPCAIAYRNGLIASPEVEKVKRHAMEACSAGLALYTPDPSQFSLNRSHMSLHETIQEDGGISRIVDNPEPMWCQVAHSHSESREHTGVRRIERTELGDDAKGIADLKYRMERFGVTHEFLGTYAKILKADISGRPSLLRALGWKKYPRIKRMQIKREILEIAKEIDREVARGKLPEAQEKRLRYRLDVLRECFYAF